MKTEEIIFALRCTSSVPQIDHDCGKCPYHEAAVADGLGEFEGCDVDQVALDAADRLEQLKREQERERPRPLPLDELRKMEGEPVWIVAGDVSWWDIVSFSVQDWLYLARGEELRYSRYGEWLAYRHKPEAYDG